MLLKKNYYWLIYLFILITDDRETSSDNSDRENSDKENSNEEN